MKFKLYNQRTAEQLDESSSLELEPATAQLAAALVSAIVKDEWLLGYIFDDAHSQIRARVSRGDGTFYQSFEDGKIRLILHHCTTRRGANNEIYPVQDGEAIQQLAPTLEIAEKSLAYYIKQAIEQGQHTVIEVRSERGNIGPLQHLVGLVEINPLILNHVDELALSKAGSIEDYRGWASMADMVLKLIEPMPVVDCSATNEGDDEGSSSSSLNLQAEVAANHLVLFNPSDKVTPFQKPIHPAKLCKTLLTVLIVNALNDGDKSE